MGIFTYIYWTRTLISLSRNMLVFLWLSSSSNRDRVRALRGVRPLPTSGAPPPAHSPLQPATALPCLRATLSRATWPVPVPKMVPDAQGCPWLWQWVKPGLRDPGLLISGGPREPPALTKPWHTPQYSHPFWSKKGNFEHFYFFLRGKKMWRLNSRPLGSQDLNTKSSFSHVRWSKSFIKNIAETIVGSLIPNISY